MARSRSKAAPLTPDLIFERALGIIDADGLKALSMRRLASDLGVEAASLYHHIVDKANHPYQPVVGLLLPAVKERLPVE